MKKTVCLALVLVLTLCGCAPAAPAAPTAAVTPTPPAESASPEPSPEASREPATLTFLPDNEVDVAQLLVGVPGDTVFFTVEGVPVTAERFLYYAGTTVGQYLAMFYQQYGVYMDLRKTLGDDGRTIGDQMKQLSYSTAVSLALTPRWADELDARLTAEEEQELVELHAAYTAGEQGEAYALQLQGVGLNDRTAHDINVTSAAYSKVREAYMAQVELTDEEVRDFIRDQDLLLAKHILIATRDLETGEPYDDAKAAEQRAKAEDILDQLRQDPSRFDELMLANSEDPGMRYYPDGYLFTAGDMVEEFEAGTRALGIGDISDLVGVDYGYHIILRLDPDCEEVRNELRLEAFNAFLEAEVAAAEVVTTEAYDSFNVADYYDGLLEFQSGLLADAEE